jgi:hypothetical protein
MVSVNASLKDIINRFPPLLKFHLHLQFSKAIATVFNNKKRDIESHAFLKKQRKLSFQIARVNEPLTPLTLLIDI